MNGLFAAIGFLTIVTTPTLRDGALASARQWFPFVGLGIGVALAVLDWGLNRGFWAITGGEFPPLLLAALLVTSLIVLTRALHLDGFMDTCDGLFGGADAGRRLEIMRDPHVGAFAVAGAICLLLITTTTLIALPAWDRLFALLIVPCLSRWAMVATMAVFPYARREDGLGSAFFAGGTRIQTLIATVLAVVAAIVFAGPTGIVLLAVAGATALVVGRYATSRLGGVTGDVYGAVNELATMAMLVTVALLTVGGILPFEPLWIIGDALNTGGGWAPYTYAP